jgi:hypothetical protein
MKPDLILVADATEARLYTRAMEGAPLQPLQAFEHPAGRRRSAELGDARPGHGSSDTRPGGVSFPPRLDPRKKEHQHFAHELAHAVDAALPGCGRLAVFAGSPFLGELKAALGPAAHKALAAAVDVDLTAFEIHELAQRIERALPPAG